MVLAGSLLAAAVYAAEEPTALEKQLAELRTQDKTLDMQLSERMTYLKAQATVAALVSASESADAAFKALRNTDKVKAIEEARSKAGLDYSQAADAARKGSSEYDALRAKEKETHARKSAADLTPEAKAAIDKELADIKKQKDEMQKGFEAQPVVLAAKAAKEAADTAVAALTKEPEYAKLAQASQEARAALNKALEETKKGDAAYNEIKTKREDLSKQIRALNDQIKAAKAAAAATK